MKRYVGLDVSTETSAVCVVDETGALFFEGACATDPDVIAMLIAEKAGVVERIVHESGPLSIWLTRELARRGAPVVCIDARAAHKALSARMNKSDRSDAVALAQLARTGWYREVHVKSEESDRLRLLLSARERLIRIRMDIEAQARGILKTYGIRLGKVRAGWSRRDFRDQLSAIVAGDPIMEAVFSSLVAVHDTARLDTPVVELDDKACPAGFVGECRAGQAQRHQQEEKGSQAPYCSLHAHLYSMTFARRLPAMREPAREQAPYFLRFNR